MSKDKTGNKSMQLSIPPKLHRNLKLASIFVTRGMKALVMEFIEDGVAKVLATRSQEEIQRIADGVREAYDVKGADMSENNTGLGE
ncbi:MAG: hypothetical protein KAJ19_16150 [Gammaproteobacteria bacterium]|nr:hypothetical protein [Gammaproteobacteria bacterium]